MGLKGRSHVLGHPYTRVNPDGTLTEVNGGAEPDEAVTRVGVKHLADLAIFH